MGKLIALLLLLPACAFAQDNNSSSSTSGTVVNQALQTNNSTGADLSYSRFSRGSVNCAGSTFGVSLIPSFSNGDYNDNNNFVGMITFTMPMNVNGTITRCAKQQDAMINLSRLDAMRAKIEIAKAEQELDNMSIQRDLNIIKTCNMYAQSKQKNVLLLSSRFEWAEKCDGLVYYDRSPFPAIE
jgi:hypothetical protein